MRIIHVSDLHLGLQYGDYSLVEDQTYILNQIIEKVSALKADVLIIAGDIYHKYTPATESFKIWSDFLEKLEPLQITTYITSGNHDSSDRLGVTSNYLKYGNIFLETEYQGALTTLELNVNDVKTYFTLLPFIRPSNVRNHHEDFKSNQYHDAMEYVLKDYDKKKDGHHILVAHQFVIHGEERPQLSDSEVQPQVGGIDAIHTSVFDAFDYVALGHIHKPQRMGPETIRYSGSPLKYSKTEANDTKGMVIIDVNETVTIGFEPLIPLRDVKVIEGELQSIIDNAPTPLSTDLVHINLTDAIRPIHAMDRLKTVYPNCVDIDFLGATQDHQKQTIRASKIIELKPRDLLAQFYQEMLEKEMTDETKNIVDDVINTVLEDQNETD